MIVIDPAPLFTIFTFSGLDLQSIVTAICDVVTTGVEVAVAVEVAVDVGVGVSVATSAAPGDDGIVGAEVGS
jgi:hypothetical protein